MNTQLYRPMFSQVSWNTFGSSRGWDQLLTLQTAGPHTAGWLAWQKGGVNSCNFSQWFCTHFVCFSIFTCFKTISQWLFQLLQDVEFVGHLARFLSWFNPGSPLLDIFDHHIFHTFPPQEMSSCRWGFGGHPMPIRTSQKWDSRNGRPGLPHQFRHH